MSPADLLQLVRTSLRPRYHVERELGQGQTGALFLATDLALKRRVAIKVLYPELTSDSISRRFIREARILASLNHPSVVAIHETGDAGGLRYYVRDYLEGEPLSHRLGRGRLSPANVAHLCRDVLGALGASHGVGVVHGDLRPANIFCLEDRYVLADFEIARVVGTANAPATTEMRQPTGEYAAPEQLTGEVSPRSDLYALGLIAYEAFTGRKWRCGASPTDADWSGVPRWFRGVLRRVLATRPADRWADAASFADALDAAEPQKRSRRVWGYAALTIAVAVLSLTMWQRITAKVPGIPPREMAVLPFETEGTPSQDSLGSGLAHLVRLNLDNLPGLSLTPARQVQHWWDEQGGTLIGEEKGRAAHDLRVHWLAHGVLEHHNDSVRVRLTVYDSSGGKTPLPVVRASASDLGALADTLALTLVRAIAPHLAQSYRIVGDVGTASMNAVWEFLRGEAAFQQDAWSLAERHFERALELDSTFALAAWRLANVKRWRRLPYEDDLRKLYGARDARLRPLDRGLIAALNEPSIRVRLAKLDSVITRFPDDAYARLLLAEELFHRGPLVGRSLDEGMRAMAEALARDSSMSLPYDHLLFAALRQGRRDEAISALRNRGLTGKVRSYADPDVLPLARLAYDERFLPWRARIRRQYLEWLADSAQVIGISRVFRTAVPWSDIPESQVALGDLLLAKAGSDSVQLASVHEGKAIGLMALGRSEEALSQIDSAAAMWGSDAAGLEQAEWRVVLRALGLPVEEVGQWRVGLRVLADDSVLGPRAAWALGLAAYAAGDTTEGGRWRTLLAERTHNLPLKRYLDALALAGRREWRAALILTDSLEVSFNASDPPDPFARAAFHLQRGSWFTALDDADGADREWRWYEASDIEGWPSGPAQAGELDGMLGVYARLLRGEALLRSGGKDPPQRAGCSYLRRVVELWGKADTGFQALKHRADSLLRRCRA